MGKGEIARYEQFLLFSHCFQKSCIADKVKCESHIFAQKTLTFDITYEWQVIHISHCKTFSLVLKSRTSVNVKYQGHIFQRMAFAGHLCFTNISCLYCVLLLSYGFILIAKHLKYYKQFYTIVGTGEKSESDSTVQKPQTNVDEEK